MIERQPLNSYPKITLGSQTDLSKSELARKPGRWWQVLGASRMWPGRPYSPASQPKQVYLPVQPCKQPTCQLRKGKNRRNPSSVSLYYFPQTRQEQVIGLPISSSKWQIRGVLRKKAHLPGLQRGCWGSRNYPHPADGPCREVRDGSARKARRGTLGAGSAALDSRARQAVGGHQRSGALPLSAALPETDYRYRVAHISFPSPARSPTLLPATLQTS